VTNQTADVRSYLYEKVGFAPTPEQERILRSDKRFILVAGGEQAGKSYVASKFLLGRCFQDTDNALYWLVAADYERGLSSNTSRRISPDLAYSRRFRNG
jgi:hypothetical protein